MRQRALIGHARGFEQELHGRRVSNASKSRRSDAETNGSFLLRIRDVKRPRDEVVTLAPRIDLLRSGHRPLLLFHGATAVCEIALACYQLQLALPFRDLIDVENQPMPRGCKETLKSDFNKGCARVGAEARPRARSIMEGGP